MNLKQDWFDTINLKAAAAIAAFGIEKLTTCRIFRDDGKESVIFWFGGSEGDTPKAESIHHWMTKGNDETKDAEEILLSQLSKDQRVLFYKAACNYIYCAAHSRDNLISDIKHFPMMAECVSKNGIKFLIPIDATEETKRKIAAML